MIPPTQSDGTQATDQIGNEIEEVKSSPVGEHTLDELGANSESERANPDTEVYCAATGGLEDPVEDQRDEEKRNQM